jgi:hypothetical protein
MRRPGACLAAVLASLSVCGLGYASDDAGTAAQAITHASEMLRAGQVRVALAVLKAAAKK